MSKRLGGGLMVATILLSLAQSAGIAAAPAGVGTGTPSAPLTGRTVTLITGDRVTVAAEGMMAIHRGKGRDPARFVTTRVGGHLQVIPSDALQLLHAGRLDRRLFDVTALLDFGYDRRTDLPLIVTNTAGRAAATSVTGAGARVVRELRAIQRPRGPGC